MTPMVRPREQRSTLELRRDIRKQLPAAVAQVRLAAAQDGDGYHLTGYASVTEVSYEVNDWLGSYVEVVKRGAFRKPLADGTAVRLLVNHDGIPLGNTRSGTLTLSEDDTGLLVDCELDAASPLVQTVKSAMDRGDLTEMSFAFQAVRESWNDDYSQRDLLEVKLFDVSLVTYPANDATSASLRSSEPGARLLTMHRQAREGKVISADTATKLQAAQSHLDAAGASHSAAQDVIGELLGMADPKASEGDGAGDASVEESDEGASTVGDQDGEGDRAGRLAAERREARRALVDARAAQPSVDGLNVWDSYEYRLDAIGQALQTAYGRPYSSSDEGAFCYAIATYPDQVVFRVSDWQANSRQVYMATYVLADPDGDGDIDDVTFEQPVPMVTDTVIRPDTDGDAPVLAATKQPEPVDPDAERKAAFAFEQLRRWRESITAA